MGDVDGIAVIRCRRKKKRTKETSRLVREKLRFKRGKCCERCGTKEKLTVHNHKLPKEKWKVLCRDCHDVVNGIVSEEKGEQIQSWYE